MSIYVCRFYFYFFFTTLRFCCSTLKLWFYFSTFTHSSSLPEANCQKHILKKMCMANIFHMPPKRLCSKFEGSGIQVTVKGNFSKINFWRLWFLVRWGGWDARRRMFSTIPPSPPHSTSMDLFLTY